MYMYIFLDFRIGIELELQFINRTSLCIKKVNNQILVYKRKSYTVNGYDVVSTVGTALTIGRSASYLICLPNKRPPVLVHLATQALVKTRRGVVQTQPFLFEYRAHPGGRLRTHVQSRKWGILYAENVR